MTQSVTDALQQQRVIVVAVDPERGHVKIKGATDACSVVACSGDTLVCCDEGTSPNLETLNPGDVVKLESGPDGRPERIVVVRRAWDELTSPEW